MCSVTQIAYWWNPITNLWIPAKSARISTLQKLPLLLFSMYSTRSLHCCSPFVCQDMLVKKQSETAYNECNTVLALRKLKLKNKLFFTFRATWKDNRVDWNAPHYIIMISHCFEACVILMWFYQYRVLFLVGLGFYY